MKRFYILIGSGLLFSSVLTGQCPERNVLWKRLIFLRDSVNLAPPAAKQLQELLTYETSISVCSYRYDTTHALLLQRIAALYLGQAEYTHALKYTLGSINISNNKKNSNEKNGIIAKITTRNYYILARIYGSLNRVAERMAAMDSCVAIAVRTGSVDIFSLYSLAERIKHLFEIGDYQRGFSTANMGEAIIKKYVHGLDSMDYIIKVLNWKVNALVDFKDYSGAEGLVITKIADCHSIGAKQFLGNLYEQLAIIHVHKHDYNKALNYFQQALSYHQQDNYDLGCEQTLTNLGYFLYFKEYKNYKMAIRTYQRALSYLKKYKGDDNVYSHDLLNLYSNIGNTLAEEGSYDSAFQYFRLAFDQIKPGLTEEDLTQATFSEIVESENVRHIMSLLLYKADAYFSQFRNGKEITLVNKAIHIYKLADQFVNIMNREQSEVLSRLLWRGNALRLYERAIEACYESGNITEAFYFFEKSRAVLLNNQLNEQRWMGATDILKQAQLKKKIFHLERELEKVNSSSVGFRVAQEELFLRKHDLDAIEKEIKIKIPLYFQNYLDSASVTIQDVKSKLLIEHQALVEFFSGDSAVYVFVITQRQTRLTKINKAAYDSTVRVFNSYITDQELLNNEFEQFTSTARRLYRLIFENNPVPNGRIIISQDGNYIPFEALIIDGSKENRYFLYDHAVSYAYSARFLMSEFNSFSNVSYNDFLGFAPVNYPPAMDLSSLSGSDLSLDRMKVYFSNATNLIGKNASKANFLKRFYSYKIIQIYSHASHTSAFSEPVIYFADSALYLSELIGEHNPITNLVILSACETGIGKLQQGEGVFGFNRGFAALGIPSTITNLWSVDNKSNYLLTELFCKYVSKNLPLDIALQKSKIDLLAGEFKLPYFWAASALTGKTNAIQLRQEMSKKSKVILIIILGLLIAGTTMWVKIKKDK